MTGFSDDVMRQYLARSIASNRKSGILNQNRLNGLLAEVDLRAHLRREGFHDRIFPGGWIARRTGDGQFGTDTVAVFPEVPANGSVLTVNRGRTEPEPGLHAMSAAFRLLGVSSHFCTARVGKQDDPAGLTWDALPLDGDEAGAFIPLETALAAYLSRRERPYQFLRYNTDVTKIPDENLAEEFCKEHLRITLQNRFVSEIADIDGIFLGRHGTYRLEIKEKTAAHDRKMGAYFGMDVGLFVKLAFYAARKDSLKSLFVVREIADTASRELKQWWYIPFERLSLFASWNQQGGGTNMRGGASTVIRIPKDRFSPLTRAGLLEL